MLQYGQTLKAWFLWELLQPIVFKTPDHLGVVSCTINVDIKLVRTLSVSLCLSLSLSLSLSLPTAGFISCHLLLQITVICETTPK